MQQTQERLKVLVIGGTGLVGNALVRAWMRRGAEVVGATYHCHASKSFRQLDIQDAAAVEGLLREIRPRVVALPAANPHVDYCELHPEETRRVNVEGSLNVARACAQTRARMIFYSSDYVFDGLQGLYGEDDLPCPVNEYGRQKAEVEAATLAMNPRNLVIRTSGAYGWQWEPKNFAMQVISRLGAGKPMKVVSDVRYNPTYVENLAEATADLVELAAGGLFHAVGSDTVARHDFAGRIARAFGLDESLIEPVSGPDFSPPARRPKESGLRTDKVRALIPTPLLGVQEGLAAMIRSRCEWEAYAKEHLPPSAAI